MNGLKRAWQAFTRHFGGNPLSLLLLLACFALAGAAVLPLIRVRPVAVIVWFVAAAVLHDIVFVPLYSLVDRAAQRLRHGPRPTVSWLNYLRFPGAISLLLLLIYFPSIARRSPRFTATTGLSASGYLPRWLAVTGALFLISALLYATRLIRVSRRAARTPAGPAADTAPDAARDYVTDGDGAA